MATSHPTSEDAQVGFAPKQPVPVPVGKLTVMLYPSVTPDMPIFERAHAFHVNRNALRLVPIEADQYLDAFGTQMCAGTTIDGLKSDFQRLFRSKCFDMSNLSIISFHDSQGAILNSATTAADPSILKPVLDGAVNACRPADVRFVRLQAMIDLTDLITDPNQTNKTLRSTYYMELPQTTVAVNNAAVPPVARNLTTFHGADDLRTLTVEQVRQDILGKVHHPLPISLMESSWNTTDAEIDTTNIGLTLNRMLYQLAIPTAEDIVFREICPGYSSKPQAAVERIKQCYTDAEGNNVIMAVHEYYSRYTQASRVFAGDLDWPIDAVCGFINGLERRVRSAFNELYRNHSEPHDRNGRHQRTQLQLILQHATIAEDKVRTIQDIAMQSSGQSFATMAANAYPSQAEQTLARYQSPTKDRSKTPFGDPPKIKMCFGCKGDHSWMQDGVIVCKHKDEPGVRERADREYAKYKIKRKKNYDRYQRSPKRGKGAGFQLDSYSDEQKKEIRRQVLQSDVTGSSANATGPSSGGPLILMLDVVAFNSQTLPPLPAPIQTNFPHILLQFGLELDSANCPATYVVVDTAAALSTGSLSHFMTIAKTFPHCVKAVYTSKNHTPITLSGIIRQGERALSSELPIAFEFHLPYKTKTGANTSFIVACGPDVAVNCIVGLPFIMSTHMIFDASDQVAECKALDCPPFKVEYKRASCTAPRVDPNFVPPIPSHFSNFISELSALESSILTPVLVTASADSVSKPAASDIIPPVPDAATLPTAELPPAPLRLAIPPTGSAPDFNLVDSQLPARMPFSNNDYYDPACGEGCQTGFE